MVEWVGQGVVRTFTYLLAGTPDEGILSVCVSDGSEGTLTIASSVPLNIGLERGICDRSHWTVAELGSKIVNRTGLDGRVDRGVSRALAPLGCCVLDRIELAGWSGVSSVADTDPIGIHVGHRIAFAYHRNVVPNVAEHTGTLVPARASEDCSSGVIDSSAVGNTSLEESAVYSVGHARAVQNTISQDWVPVVISNASTHNLANHISSGVGHSLAVEVTLQTAGVPDKKILANTASSCCIETRGILEIFFGAYGVATGLSRTPSSLC